MTILRSCSATDATELSMSSAPAWMTRLKSGIAAVACKTWSKAEHWAVPSVHLAADRDNERLDVAVGGDLESRTQHGRASGRRSRTDSTWTWTSHSMTTPEADQGLPNNNEN